MKFERLLIITFEQDGAANASTSNKIILKQSEISKKQK